MFRNLLLACLVALISLSRAPSAKADLASSLNVFCNRDRSDCTLHSAVQVSTAAKKAALYLYFVGGSGSHDCLSVSFDVYVNDVFAFTSPLLAPKAKSESFFLGDFPPNTGVWVRLEERVVADTCQVSNSIDGYSVDMNILRQKQKKNGHHKPPRKEFDRLLSSPSPLAGLKVASSGIDYHLESWNPAKPIDIGFGKKLLKRLKGVSSRDDRFALNSLWPERGTLTKLRDCGGLFKASQQGVTRGLPLSAPATHYLAYASDELKGLRTHALLCDGEIALLDEDYATSELSPANPAQNFRFVSFSTSAAQSNSNNLLTPENHICLGRTRNRHVMLKLLPSKVIHGVGGHGKCPAPQAHAGGEFDVYQVQRTIQDVTGLVRYAPGSDIDAVLDWYHIASGPDVEVKHDLLLKGAVVFVDGNLKVDGDVTGTGLLAVAGSLWVKGKLKLESGGVSGYNAGLEATGDVVIEGDK